MISKKRALYGAVLLVLITSIVTFALGNFVSLAIGNKVIITENDYNTYKELYAKHQKLIDLENYIHKNFLNEVDDEKLLDGQIKGMFESLEDPYSVYMNKEEFTSFMEHTKGTYGGIGVIVTPGDDNYITVVSPIEDTPGERAFAEPPRYQYRETAML